MAEGTGNSEDNNGGSWWGSWVTAAREKTEKAFEMMSQDIAEFTTTMQTDTKKVVEKTKETIQQQSSEGGVRDGSGGVTDKMAASFHHLMEGITKVLTVEAEDASPTTGLGGSQVQHPGTGIFDRAKIPKSRVEARLRAIQVDTGTYLSEPSGPPELYGEWLKTFNLDAYKGEVSDLLVSMVEVRSLYTSLVPSEVSHQDFWGRYFYKLHQLDRDEARKQALMQRAERANVKEDSISWDEEWSGDDESGSPEASRQKTKPPSNTDASPTQNEVTEDLKSRLNPDVQKDQDANKSQQKNVTQDKHVSDDSQQQSDEISASSPSSDDTQSKVKHKDSDETETKPTPESNTTTDLSGKSEPETKTEENENVTVESSPSERVMVEKCDTDSVEGAEGTVAPVVGEGIKTKLKGDMVVVTETDRVSPTSESSGTKESSTEDWEKDFDVDITPEDLAAATELAQKMNTSATDYTKIAEGAEDDWESWE